MFPKPWVRRTGFCHPERGDPNPVLPACEKHSPDICRAPACPVDLAGRGAGECIYILSYIY